MSNPRDEAPQMGAALAHPEYTECAPDPQIVATAALHGCPAWAEDNIATLPTGAITTAASDTLGSVERAAVERSTAVTACPLHIAMRHLAEAAVAQHVLYLEGEVRSRPDLVTTISRWERMHTLIRECICPATREVSLGSAALTAGILDATLEEMFTPGQQSLRTQFIQALAVCAGCQSAAECPLGAAPDAEHDIEQAQR